MPAACTHAHAELIENMMQHGSQFTRERCFRLIIRCAMVIASKTVCRVSISHLCQVNDVDT